MHLTFSILPPILGELEVASYPAHLRSSVFLEALVDPIVEQRRPSRAFAENTEGPWCLEVGGSDVIHIHSLRNQNDENVYTSERCSAFREMGGGEDD